MRLNYAMKCSRLMLVEIPVGKTNYNGSMICNGREKNNGNWRLADLISLGMYFLVRLCAFVVLYYTWWMMADTNNLTIY